MTIDKQRLQRDRPAPHPTQLRRLMMDEFAVHKGHRYATVFALSPFDAPSLDGHLRANPFLHDALDYQVSTTRYAAEIPVSVYPDLLERLVGLHLQTSR
ncbi:hypothetical protein [Halomonas sp. CKK8]|uniref:hypothetical protein n=1 Tax=Halomonas sp. CKK8 TaxID=3036127 RepID=UPI0024152E6C|nr:hypothetical protein [Halomonas sp. CKK8]WFM70982.1 hypothetical protein P8934_16540 [Halomonas sp. CKK8]